MAINARNLGLWNNACLAFKTNPEVYLKTNSQEGNRRYEHGQLEKIGNALVWHVEHFPFKAYKLISDPRIVTIAATIFTMYSIQFLFYTKVTKQWTTWAIDKALELIKPHQIKFATYLACETAALGYGLRSFSRFNNPDLLIKYAYACKKTDEPS